MQVLALYGATVCHGIVFLCGVNLPFQLVAVNKDILQSVLLGVGDRLVDCIESLGIVPCAEVVARQGKVVGGIKDGELFLTERIKDLFKTSNGKYIAPQAIESKLVVDRYIDQIAIVADQRKYVTALIVPTYDVVREYAAKHRIVYQTMDELLKNERIMQLYKERIDTLQQQLAHYEQVKYFTLLPEPFSMEKGELTNTLKIKRQVVYRNYAAEIEKMYEE